MVLSEKKLIDEVAKKFDLSDAEVKNVFFCFGCTVFSKNIASFAKDEAYYLWSGYCQKGKVTYYFACRIDGIPEEIEKDVCEISEVIHFIARNQQMYSLLYDIQGRIVIVPWWYLDIERVKKSAHLQEKGLSVKGKLDYVCFDNDGFWAWLFYSNEAQIVKVFNLENGRWIDAEEFIARLSLQNGHLIKDIQQAIQKSSVQMRTVC